MYCCSIHKKQLVRSPNLKCHVWLAICLLHIQKVENWGSKFSTFLGHAESSTKNTSTLGKKVSTVQVCSKITSLTTKSWGLGAYKTIIHIHHLSWGSLKFFFFYRRTSSLTAWLPHLAIGESPLTWGPLFFPENKAMTSRFNWWTKAHFGAS